MIASAYATIEAPNVLRRVHSGPPLTIRQVSGENADVCALCLVGSAAGPLPGDELLLDLQVADGASASLVATGASIAQGYTDAPAIAQGYRDAPAIAQGYRDAPSRLRTIVTVGENASLDADPGALIVCAGARVDVEVSIRLAATSTLRWRELIVLGRTGEPAGRARLDWRVERAGRALLRQLVDLTDPDLIRWPGMLGERRILLSELRVGPNLAAGTTVHDAGGHVTAVTLRLAQHATLTTVLAADVQSAVGQLREAMAER